MIFSEIYGTYYRVLEELLGLAVEGGLTRAELEAVIRSRGFGESILTIPEKLADGSWPLLTPELKTPLKHRPERPLTTLEKRWLKAILLDPRMKLFDPPMDGLEDTEPLYPKGAIVYFDRYTDGDPFGDPGYIANFRTILQALREKRRLHLQFEDRHGVPHHWDCVPLRLEYSGKDDKFRLITGNNRTALSVNVARITGCGLLEVCRWQQPRAMRRETLVLELYDQRNALERAMLHFSHLEKETERVGEDRYRLTLRYEREDETELLIRVLSFGPALKVISPSKFRNRLKDRLIRQMQLWDGADADIT